MKNLIILLVVFVVIWICTRPEKHKQLSSFGADAQNYALAALEDMDEHDFLNDRIPEVTTHYLAQNAANVDVVAELDLSHNGIEKLSFSNPINTQNWQYYRTLPYQGKSGGVFAPSLLNRTNQWEPGFQTSGWSLWLRPSITYDRWPRNRWVKQNNRYYYINNGSEKDRLRDYTGEPS